MRLTLPIAAFLCPMVWAQEGRFELPAEQRTGSIRRIFVVSHSHLDIGFTKPPDDVARDYKDNIDHAIKLARENEDFRWTIESAWMLDQWLRRTEDEALVEELARLLRGGRIELGAAFANMHSGLMGAEESNRLVYLGHRLRRKFGIEAGVAYQNDVPGFTWAYPRILTGSGVGYLVMGLNLFIGGGNSLGPGKNPFYWVGPDGSRVLTYFTYDSYVEGYRWKLSARFSLADLEASVPRRLAWLERNGYRYDTYLLMASAGDNADPLGAYRILERIREWNRRHPDLPMKMATAEEFFGYLIGRYGSEFPEARGDAAGHWEIVKLRAPEAAAKVRQASNSLPAAEMAATIASLLKRSFFPRVDLSEAWNALLTFHEHTADGAAGWPGYFSRWQTDWHNIAHYATGVSGFQIAEQHLSRALQRIGGQPETAAGRSTVMVWNGLSWKRSGPVIVDRLPSGLRKGPLAVTDLESGEKLSYEDVPGTERQILFAAEDVPPVGYRLYAIENGSPPSEPKKPEFPLQMEWSHSGTLTSVVERASRREMIAPTPERPFGALFVEHGRSGFELESGGPAKVRVEEGALTRRIAFERAGSAMPLSVVTLYRDVSYADLRFDVDLDVFRNGPGKQQRYAIALPVPREGHMVVDGAGFVIRVPEDVLPGGAPPHFTPVLFAHWKQPGGWGVTLANKDGFALRPDMLFAVASQNLEAQTRDEGIQRLYRTEPRGSSVQSFRFRLGVQGEKPWEWKRFGSEAGLPLRAVAVDGGHAPRSRGFFEVSHPEVQLQAFKAAEHSPGWYMLRLQEIAGTGAKRVHIKTSFQVREAKLANMVEEPLNEAFDFAGFSIGAWQTLTVLARME